MAIPKHWKWLCNGCSIWMTLMFAFPGLLSCFSSVENCHLSGSFRASLTSCFLELHSSARRDPEVSWEESTWKQFAKSGTDSFKAALVWEGCYCLRIILVHIWLGFFWSPVLGARGTGRVCQFDTQLFIAVPVIWEFSMCYKGPEHCLMCQFLV